MSNGEALRLVESPPARLAPYERIRATLRPEFLGDRYVPQQDDLALWGRSCAADECEGFDVSGKNRLCRVHRARLHYLRTSLTLSDGPQRGGDLTVESYLSDPTLHGGPVVANHPGFDFTGLPEKVELELRLLVQARSRNRATQYRVQEHQRIRKEVLRAGLDSLIVPDFPETSRWVKHAPIPEDLDGAPAAIRAHVRFAASLASEVGWPVTLMERDRWHAHDFTAPAGRAKTITWTGFEQEWFKRWLKEWAAHRLATGWSFSTAVSNIGRMLYFSRYLSQSCPEVTGPEKISREVLVGFLAWIKRESGMAETQRQSAVSVVKVLIEDHRLNEWEPKIPESAILRTGELPKRGEMLPRPIEQFVVQQMMAESNLKKARPDVRLAILILNGHGLRIGSVVELQIDCLGTDSDGFPTLRYRNTKRQRERLHPIRDPEIVAGIEAQQARARAKHGPDVKWLFPRVTGNLAGEYHMTTAALRTAISEYLRSANIVDRDGKPAHITPHQFRHTFGTRELNNGAPQEVVQELLDHDDPAMTRGYARLTDKTLREKFIAANRFNASGERLEDLLPDSPLADLAWMKERLNRAKVTLPNGYCSLPLQQTCEVQNACLDCTDYFVTTPEFIPAHEAQRKRTLDLIAASEGAGQERMAQKNRQVLVKLEHLIATLRREG